MACGACGLTSSPLLNALSRWDGSWYVQIAREGYSYEQGVRSSVAFFPVFPLLTRAVAQLIGRVDDTTLVIAGIVVANGALVVALAYLAGASATAVVLTAMFASWYWIG